MPLTYYAYRYIDVCMCVCVRLSWQCVYIFIDSPTIFYCITIFLRLLFRRILLTSKFSINMLAFMCMQAHSIESRIFIYKMQSKANQSKQKHL